MSNGERSIMINSFSGEYRFLSNFYPSPVEYEGVTYASVEHAYQAAKTLDPSERACFAENITAGLAKRLGRSVSIRPDWEEIKIDVMYDLVGKKFQNQDLKTRLLETGSRELVEGNYWGDTFWGVCRGVGKNHLGKILMMVRSGHMMDKVYVLTLAWIFLTYYNSSVPK
jgi:N-glycosidase YbiA